MQHSASASGVHTKTTPSPSVLAELAELAEQCLNDPVAFETTTRATAEAQGVPWRPFREIVRAQAKALRASRVCPSSVHDRWTRQEAGTHFGAAHFPSDCIVNQARALLAFLAARYGAQPFTVGRRNLRVHCVHTRQVVDLEADMLASIVWAWDGVATFGPERRPLRLRDNRVKLIVRIAQDMRRTRNTPAPDPSPAPVSAPAPAETQPRRYGKVRFDDAGRMHIVQ